MDSGIILLDKPIGLTSRACDNRIQRIFGTKKVGHMGTLDPFATGLLVLGVNQGCKALTYIKDDEKTYVAELLLGKKTSTGDNTSEIISEQIIPSNLNSKIPAVFASFLGKSLQIPPMTSAIKINGEALYKKAHRGETVEREPREIEVYSLKLLDHRNEIIRFEATVSGGTYMRTLGEDIAEKLGTCGHLISLRRTKIGHLDVKDALTPEEIGPTSLLNPANYIDLPKINVNSLGAESALNGRPLVLDRSEEKVLIIHDDKAIAVYKRTDEKIYRPERGLF